MTTLLLTSIILVFLLIILGITFRKPIIRLIRKHQDTKLRKWCVQQAIISKTFDSYDPYTETYYASSNAVAASAERIYLFIKEYITYLSDEEKEAIFPEKYKKKRRWLTSDNFRFCISRLMLQHIQYCFVSLFNSYT